MATSVLTAKGRLIIPGSYGPPKSWRVLRDKVLDHMNVLQKHKLVIHAKYGKGIILVREEYQDNFMVNFYNKEFYPNVQSVYWQELEMFYPNYNVLWQQINE